jgi:uncharacterized membrane protein YeaQ/YmgE (transglycosylase-associated protein family)
MDAQQTIVFLVIGGVAGLLAGLIVKGGGLGLVGNIVAGVLGALLGGWLFKLLKINIGGGEWVGPLVTATAGAIVILVVVGLIKKKD